MKKATIGFAGLTHLGLNSLVASAERGFTTVGFHEDDTLVQNLRNGVININEPQLFEFYQKNKNLILTRHIRDSCIYYNNIYILHHVIYMNRA